MRRATEALDALEALAREAVHDDDVRAAISILRSLLGFPAALEVALQRASVDDIVAAVKATGMATFKKPRINASRDATLTHATECAEAYVVGKLRLAIGNHHRAGSAHYRYADELAAAILAMLAALAGAVGFEESRIDKASLLGAAGRVQPPQQPPAAAVAAPAAGGGAMDEDGNDAAASASDDGSAGAVDRKAA